jgi:hypothetical protein
MGTYIYIHIHASEYVQIVHKIHTHRLCGLLVDEFKGQIWNNVQASVTLVNSHRTKQSNMVSDGVYECV